MSARHAPISPNIPPEAPTLIDFGKKTADSMVPPIAGTTKRNNKAKEPCACSITLPIAKRPIMLSA
eukprot:CAMPEP_0172422830 /NCGR_PEP_ID=MMETSP1064-20121228/8953_1 /TAXON_ID=202472 /ORGANISM="Aulacoseira subarctica , Strain CCAP 1002/5" /LENGTH=65 /DNA_ID=CAMNT_0013163883 /DNA_START=549 /DNA_END=746 /DNA_ORIENTATION=+